MYAMSTRPSAKHEVQKDRSAKLDDQIARPRRAQTCERSELRAMRMCSRSGQIFLYSVMQFWQSRQNWNYFEVFAWILLVGVQDIATGVLNLKLFALSVSDSDHEEIICASDIPTFRKVVFAWQFFIQKLCKL